MRRLAYMIGLMAAAAAAPAQAGVLFDTINGTTQTSNTLARIVAPGSATGPTSYGGPLGVQFTTTYSSQIAGVTMRMVDSTPNDGGSVMVYLVNDSGNAPTTSGVGSALTLTGATLLGSILDSAIGTLGNHAINMTATPTIAAGTYWLVAVNTHPGVGGVVSNAVQARWAYTTDFSTGVGVGGYNFGQYAGPNVANGGTPVSFNAAYDPAGLNVGLPPINGLFMASIEAPEPATLAVLGVSLAALGFARRRRNAASA